MITIAICEDEPYFVSELKRMLREYSVSRGIGLSVRIFSDGERLLASRQPADIVLMDVRLPGQDGVEAVRRLRERGFAGAVIFVTAYQQYVFQALDLDVVHYILKPLNAEKLFPALDRALKRAASHPERSILLSSGAASRRIPIGDILYCEALNHQITVHTAAERFQFFGTLDAIQEKLDSRFFRCHRSYLINMSRVSGRKPGLAVMAGGDEVLVARRRQREFAQRLLDTFREELM